MKRIALLMATLSIGMSQAAQARYYDPGAGRFITPDTLVQSPYDPQTLNRYAYVRNNPLRYTDPTGHFFGDIGKAFDRAKSFVENLTPKTAFAVANPTAWVATMPLVNYGTSHRSELISGAQNFVNHFSVGSALQLANPIFWASSTPMGWEYERTHPNQVGYAATAALLIGTGLYVPGSVVQAYALNGALAAQALSVADSSIDFNNGDPTIRDVRGSVVFNNALREGAWGAASGALQGEAYMLSDNKYYGFDRTAYYINNALWNGAGVAAIRGQNPIWGAAKGGASAWYDARYPSSSAHNFPSNR